MEKEAAEMEWLRMKSSRLLNVKVFTRQVGNNM